MNMYKIESEIDHNELEQYIASDLDADVLEGSLTMLDGGGFTIKTIDKDTDAVCHWSGDDDELSKYKIDLMMDMGTPCLEYGTIYTVEGLSITQELEA